MPNCVRRPERSCGWKTPPHNRRTATDRPSSPGQREGRPGFRLHMVHRNGAKRSWTAYRARKKPSRPQGAWWQGYGPHPGSAGVPSAYMFSRGARSSSISVCLLDRGRTVRKRHHSLLLYPPQLLGSEPGQLFHGQAPRLWTYIYKGKERAKRVVVPPHSAPCAVAAVAASLPASSWYERTVSEGTKGPIAYAFARQRVTLCKEGLPERPGWLVIKRTLGVEPTYSYYISNAPASTPLRTLVWLSGVRWA